MPRGPGELAQPPNLDASSKGGIWECGDPPAAILWPAFALIQKPAIAKRDAVAQHQRHSRVLIEQPLELGRIAESDLLDRLPPERDCASRASTEVARKRR